MVADRSYQQRAQPARWQGLGSAEQVRQQSVGPCVDGDDEAVKWPPAKLLAPPGVVNKAHGTPTMLRWVLFRRETHLEPKQIKFIDRPSTIGPSASARTGVGLDWWNWARVGLCRKAMLLDQGAQGIVPGVEPREPGVLALQLLDLAQHQVQSPLVIGIATPVQHRQPLSPPRQRCKGCPTAAGG